MALFSQEIKSGGRFTCAMPSDRVYVLAFESPPANQLTHDFVEAFCSSLSKIQAFPKGVVITASRIPEIYSEGIDPHISQYNFEGQEHIWPLLRQLLRYPMPTITLISGKTAGLGLILSLCHDFRVQKPRGSSQCIYDGQFATPLLSKWMKNFMKAKLPGLDITSLMSDGKNLRARDCVRCGLVDETGFFADALRLVKRRRLLDAGTEEGYGMRKQLRNQSALLLLDTKNGKEIKAHRL